MNLQILQNTISHIFPDSKGILAMDESNSTCNKRFKAEGIPQTEEMRRQYRELLVTTEGLNESIGGAILSDETIKQQTSNGLPMADVLSKAGIVPGIKVDKHAKSLAGFPGEKVTEGLDKLRDRLEEYKEMGARFAKWRAVIAIGEGIPTSQCIEANAHTLCRYAALCQETDLVPIVEPEVLMEGDHSIDQCCDVTREVQKVLFYMLYRYRVDLTGVILKCNMVLPGKDSGQKVSPEEVAHATINCLRESVPVSVPAIAFLSGGQSPEEATTRLNTIHEIFNNQLPWIVSFSFARAIQRPVLARWNGQDEQAGEAQKILYQRAKYSSAARNGTYDPSMEN